mmetsp:Transcript_29124/g.73081  ORF Transcript_29124/g.73081 Transcript_29124/m.73081 type:complete len:231 (+) Transcript_29124:205-897(+)
MSVARTAGRAVRFECSPERTPGRLQSPLPRRARIASSVSSSIRSREPASVILRESSWSSTPSSEALCESWYRLSSARCFTSYMHAYFELPAARSSSPSAEKLTARKLWFALLLLALTRLPADLPPSTSLRPSMVPTCSAISTSHSESCPSRVEVHNSEPSWLNASASTSVECLSTSERAFCETKSHRRTVPSHEADARIEPDGPPNARAERGLACPLSCSSSCALCMLHT